MYPDFNTEAVSAEIATLEKKKVPHFFRRFNQLFSPLLSPAGHLHTCGRPQQCLHQPV